MINKKQILFVMAFYFLLPFYAHAQIPTADTIPDNLRTKDKGLLSSDRSELMNEYSSLTSAISSHDTKCSRVADTDQGLISACSSEMQNLKAKVQAYQTKLTEFDNLLKQTVTTNVNTDSNVVDARNMPSSLPKSIDDAIASAYANAPAGVSERVRKGFQAVLTHDWKVAKAWFGDALYHDPDNTDLKKFVKLADIETEERSSAHISASSLSQEELMKIFDDMPIPTETQRTNDYMFEQLLKMAENDPALKKSSEEPHTPSKVIFPHN